MTFSLSSFLYIIDNEADHHLPHYLYAALMGTTVYTDAAYAYLLNYLFFQVNNFNAVVVCVSNVQSPTITAHTKAPWFT
jgi:pyrroloquinoline quinone (PQQ) biosynthesis protein C